MKVTVYSEDGCWCVEVEGSPKVYVYPTMRSALRMVESLLKGNQKFEGEPGKCEREA